MQSKKGEAGWGTSLIVPSTPPHPRWPPSIGNTLVCILRFASSVAAPPLALSFHSHYCDFEKWAVVGIPGFGPLDLHEFWQDMSLRVVCYAHPASALPQVYGNPRIIMPRGARHRGNATPSPAFLLAKSRPHSPPPPQVRWCCIFQLDNLGLGLAAVP